MTCISLTAQEKENKHLGCILKYDVISLMGDQVSNSMGVRMGVEFMLKKIEVLKLISCIFSHAKHADNPIQPLKRRRRWVLWYQLNTVSIFCQGSIHGAGFISDPSWLTNLHERRWLKPIIVSQIITRFTGIW